MKKKIMSALLLCVMAVLFCVPAFAANTSDTEASEPLSLKVQAFRSGSLKMPQPLILTAKSLPFIGMSMKTVKL